MSIGQEIKQHRVSKGLTLQALSELSGVSKSMLSEIENNKKTPSIDVALRISNALKISILTLIAAKQQVPQTSMYTKAGEHITLTDPSSGLHLQFIGPHGQVNAPKFAFGTMPPNSKTQIYPPLLTNVAIYFYIIQGTLHIRLGETTYTLSQGDSLYYKPDVEQQLSTEGPEECHFTTLRLHLAPDNS